MSLVTGQHTYSCQSQHRRSFSHSSMTVLFTETNHLTVLGGVKA